MKRSEESQLRLRPFGGGYWAAFPVAVADSVLFPQTRHQLRYPFAVGLRQEGAVFVALLVIGCKLGKFFLQKGEEYRRGAGFQEGTCAESQSC